MCNSDTFIMPAQTRATRNLKPSKDKNIIKKDIIVSNKNKAKSIVKPYRKPLADKTNSSEESASISSTNSRSKRKLISTPELNLICEDRPRRARRLPSRYEENDLLKNLSNNNLSSPRKIERNSLTKAGPCNSVKKLQPIKNVSKILNNDKKLQPIKNVSKILNNDKKLQPIKNVSKILNNDNNKNKNEKNAVCNSKSSLGVTKNDYVKGVPKQSMLQYTKDTKNSKCYDASSTKLRNRKNRNVFYRSTNDIHTPVGNKVALVVNKPSLTKVSVSNSSIRLLENKRKSLKRDSGKLDVYEFTYDPNEEPPAMKKKKRKATNKPKTQINKVKRVVKNNYEKNLAQALAALKNAVSSKPLQRAEDKILVEKSDYANNNKSTECVGLATESQNRNISGVSEDQYNSIRVEDIAKQFEEDNDDHAINYSPINSPNHDLPSPIHPNIINANAKTQLRNKDPLNLHSSISFFDEKPLANSSMNTSVRDPLASPWRVEFNNLPLKWQVNSYVKPNMTPAVESSFINFDNNKKKHVYTNILAETNEQLPPIVENTPNLKQTSIISFIKEMAEKSANKKKRNNIVKNNSLFEDVTNSNITKQKTLPESAIATHSSNTVEVTNDVQTKKVICQSSENNVIDSEPIKNVEKDGDVTFYGFDDSEDQENVSPVKKSKRSKTKATSRVVLREINNEVNTQMEVPLPFAARSKHTTQNNVNKVFEEIKSGMEPPAFPEVTVDKNNEAININDDLIETNLDDDDLQSVHLFEDVDVVHHLKPLRKSYGKTKKVTFHKSSTTLNSESEEDNSDDLSFRPSMKQQKVITKKKSKKRQKTKKEKEADAWAAEFNSMCENIDQFDLVVE